MRCRHYGVQRHVLPSGGHRSQTGTVFQPRTTPPCNRKAQIDHDGNGRSGPRAGFSVQAYERAANVIAGYVRRFATFHARPDRIPTTPSVLFDPDPGRVRHAANPASRQHQFFPGILGRIASDVTVTNSTQRNAPASCLRIVSTAGANEMTYCTTNKRKQCERVISHSTMEAILRLFKKNSYERHNCGFIT